MKVSQILMWLAVMLALMAVALGLFRATGMPAFALVVGMGMSAVAFLGWALVRTLRR